jgi:Fe(3+) dicitrate transport protein
MVGTFATVLTHRIMTTIGKRYLERTKGKDDQRVLDTRTRSVLNAVLSEKRGKALDAYLKAMGTGVQRTLAALVLIALATASIAQQNQLNGTVRSSTGQALAFVNVALSGTGMGSTTDKNGRFSINSLADGEYSVVASMVGYSNGIKSVRVPSSDTVSLILEERIVDLPIFTVQQSMTGGSGPLRDRAGSAWYIGPREMQQFAYTDVSRLLRSVPGVNVQEEDGFGLRPNIGMRGAGPERSAKITVMEDGILAAPAAYSSPAAYYFPTVGRMSGIEVVKGSSQVRFGPLTTGGAINFISTPIPERTSGMVAAWGGSYGLRNLHAQAGTEIQRGSGDRIGLMVETFQQAADGFKVLDNGGPTGFNKQDHLAKLNWRTKADAKIQQAIAIKAGITNEASDETYLGLSRADFDLDPLRRYAGSQKDLMKVEHDQFSAQYAIELPRGPKLVATVYRTNTYRNWYKLDQVVDSSGTKVGIAGLLDRPEDHPFAFDVVRGGNSDDNALLVKSNNRNYQTSGAQLIATHTIKGEKTSHGFELGARLHGDYMDRFQWTDGFRMQGGNMLQTSFGRPGTESNRIASAEALATHALYDLKVGKLGVHPGVRHEHIVLREENYGTQDPDRTGSNLKTTENMVDVWIPGIGVDWQITSGSMAFAGVHRGFSPPGTNPETRPEASINYETGVRYNTASSEIQVIGFFNDYSELLGSDMAAAGGVGSGDLFNGGKAVVKGVEAFVSHDPLHARSEHLRLPIRIGYTFTDARFGSSFNSTFEGWGQVLEGDRIPFIATHQANGRIALECRRGSVHVNATYVSDMPAQAGPSADEPSLQVPAFTVVDLGGTYRFTPGIEAFATVQNMLNNTYLVSLVPAGARPGMPRAIQAGLRLRF